MIESDIIGLKEKEFESYYYSLTDPNEQIEKLNEWRCYQCDVVSKFIDQIRLMANEQYTSLDHFLLELLQNADDNDYKSGVAPTVKIELSDDCFKLINNEIGFQAEHVFAITYSAASTKLREKTAATYIGEKGIGFKSVFSVADKVEIHSSPYHFYLKNDEFIVPHITTPIPCTGTQIILKLKETNSEIPKILSDHLQILCTTSQEFTLFLQKIETLEVIDQISGTSGKVITLRDKKRGYYVVENNGNHLSFITISYDEHMPANIVQTRFKNLDSELSREIIFAVPVPSEENDSISNGGRVFCFLPTGVITGTPIHIQVDAKTITNRENIADFRTSEWNKTIFQNFVPEMVKMYVKLTKKEEIKYHLPAYWPYNIDEQSVNNEDIKSLMLQVSNELANQPVILDRRGNFKKPAFVRILPKGFYPYFYKDKYEKVLSRHLVEDTEYEIESEKESESENVYTFVSNVWAEKYQEQLMALGVETIDSKGCMAIIKEGPPKSLDINNDEAVRQFIELVMDFGDSISSQNTYYGPNIEDFKSCKIFPTKSRNKRRWGELKTRVMWLQSDSPDTKGSIKTTIIDPKFTYSPGGRSTKTELGKRIREFNKRFREFLTDDLEIPPYSVAEYMKRTIIKDLKNASTDMNKREERRKINERWVQLYQQIWRRKKTIVREKDETYFNGLLIEISKCKIPVRLAGENKWKLEKVSNSFLGQQFRTKYNLNKIYKETGAPIIGLGYIEKILKKSRSKKQRRVDWEDWREFLKNIGAHDGPYMIDKDIYFDSGYSSSTNHKYTDLNNVFAQKVKQAIFSHIEFKSESVQNFRLRPNSITFDLDPYSTRIISDRTVDLLTKKISKFWGNINDYRTNIKFVWGYKQNSRYTSTEHLLFFDRLKDGLYLNTDKGYYMSTECFNDNKFNKKILQDLVPYVNAKTQGYDPEFLSFVGVRDTVTPSDLFKKTQKWYEGTPKKNRNSLNFTPYINPFLRFCKVSEPHKSEIKANIRLYAEDVDELLPLYKWKEKIRTDEYPKSLVDEILALLDVKKETTFEELLDLIFIEEDLNNRLNSLPNILQDLGTFCQTGNSDKIATVFNEKLKEKKISFLGEPVEALNQLPIFWNEPPYPERKLNIFRLPPHFWTDKSFQKAIEVLNWPLLSKLPQYLKCDRTEELNERLARQIYYVFHELLKNIADSQPVIKTRIDNLKLFHSTENIKQKILITDRVRIGVPSSGKQIEIDMPYWYVDGTLYIENQLPVETILPEFVDLKCGTTFAGLFKYVWNDQELASRVYTTGGSSATESEEVPGHPKKGKDEVPSDLNNGIKSDLDDSIFDDENDEDDDDEQSDNGSDEPKRMTRIRSRLYSYVVKPGQNKSTQEGRKNAARNRKVEKAGVAKLKAYFDKIGASLRSVEDENLGYDFEVTVGDETLYIELKSSEYKWDGWEESLSPNEFSKAKELKEKYFLCVIDQVLSDNYQMFFIKNPAESVDGFLFDHPWKSISIDMNSYISALKLTQEDLED